jgi:hypothetical protein
MDAMSSQCDGLQTTLNRFVSAVCKITQITEKSENWLYVPVILSLKFVGFLHSKTAFLAKTD